jgi:hypothetical protein
MKNLTPRGFYTIKIFGLLFLFRRAIKPLSIAQVR